MTVLTHDLLRDYANTFRTYGGLSNPVWFLGLEEGGGRDLDEASRKILAWHATAADRRNHQALTDPDLDGDHRDSPFLRTEGKPAKLQTTWAAQLRVLMGMRGEPLHNDRVRHLQTRVHGSLDGPTCLMELFPLPCKSAGDWVYGEVPCDAAANEPNVFASKKAYRDHYLPKRLTGIEALVKEHRPAALVCTSWTHRHALVERLEDSQEIDLGVAGAKRQAIIGRWHDTVVAVCSHPAVQIAGPRNAFYHALGAEIATRLPEDIDLKLAA